MECVCVCPVSPELPHCGKTYRLLYVNSAPGNTFESRFFPNVGASRSLCTTEFGTLGVGRLIFPTATKASKHVPTFLLEATVAISQRRMLHWKELELLSSSYDWVSIRGETLLGNSIGHWSALVQSVLATVATSAWSSWWFSLQAGCGLIDDFDVRHRKLTASGEAR
ncbi:histidine kinase [Anopheles sinensis]|uniref:Histidine kinase n=1 Tax=Anopheles sinensis TaxID=74873 RepID=A0A084VSM3_ANOSI|nr:histidine kinase [Anopheles sinensis]